VPPIVIEPPVALAPVMRIPGANTSRRVLRWEKLAMRSAAVVLSTAPLLKVREPKLSAQTAPTEMTLGSIAGYASPTWLL
jgi:hypothetical protein